jgi:quercetin dioxygenase-like cupin family protein
MSVQIETMTAVVRKGPVRVLRAFGDELTVLLSGEDTGGKYCMAIGVTPPGGGPPRHVHMREDEWFHVLEGRVEFWKDGRWTEVGPGGTVFMPRGTPHTFRNVGEGDSRMLVQAAPAGFEVFFGRCAEEFAKGGEPDMERLVAIAEEHGMQFLGDREG